MRDFSQLIGSLSQEETKDLVRQAIGKLLIEDLAAILIRLLSDGDKAELVAHLSD